MRSRFVAFILACLFRVFSIHVSAEESSPLCSSQPTTTPLEQSIPFLEDLEKLFALALEHQSRGEFEKALECYQRRMSLGGSDLELYKTMMGMGLMQELLKRPSKDIEDSFEMAFSLQSIRAEPLYCLGIHYRSQKDFINSYRVLKVAVNIPYPNTGTDKQLYDWAILFAFSISAHLVGQHQEAMAAYDALLANTIVPIEYRRVTSANRECALSQMKDPRFTVQPIRY